MKLTEKQQCLLPLFQAIVNGKIDQKCVVKVREQAELTDTDCKTLLRLMRKEARYWVAKQREWLRCYNLYDNSTKDAESHPEYIAYSNVILAFNHYTNEILKVRDLIEKKSSWRMNLYRMFDLLECCEDSREVSELFDDIFSGKVEEFANKSRI